MKKVIRAAVKPWKTKYQIHWVSPDGKDCLLGGTNDIDKAQEIAIEQADEIFDNPWETNARKFHFLENLYIVDMETEDPDQMKIETEEYIDNLMSEIHSRMSLEEKKKINSSEAAVNDREYVIGLINDKTDEALAFVSGYRKGGFYHPGDIVQCVTEIEMSPRIFNDINKAKRVMAQYKNYSEAFVYDMSSLDYPLPSQKLKRKEIPTHLEVLPLVDEEVTGCSVTASTEIEASTSFDDWYDALSYNKQMKVDDLADEMGLPEYDQCSDAELAQLHDSFVSSHDSDVDEYYEFDEDTFLDEFLDVETKVLDDMGLYIDSSSVRGGYGPIWIFSDPEHENNADMWFGDLDEALCKMDWAEYMSGLASEVGPYPKDQWKDRYTAYLKKLIDQE